MRFDGKSEIFPLPFVKIMLYYIKQEEALTMTQTLEERFAQKWLANCDKMEALGIPTANIRKLQETHGALAAAGKQVFSGHHFHF